MMYFIQLQYPFDGVKHEYLQRIKEKIMKK